MFLASCFVFGVLPDLPSSVPPEVLGDMINKVEMTGTARGGCLKLVCEPATGKYKTCEVETFAGQTGDQVAEALQKVLESTPGVQNPVRKENKVYLPWGWGYYLAGSETGFKLIQAPQFVTFTIVDDHHARVNWLPEDNPGIIVVFQSAILFEPAPLTVGESLAGKTWFANEESESSVLNEGELKVRSRLNYEHFFPPPMIFDLSSRPTRIYVSGRRQEDLDNVPFYGSVMPNWVAWSPVGFEEGALRLYQGEKAEVPEPDRFLISASSPDTKFTCQMFEIPKDTTAETVGVEPAVVVDGGVYRRYLGLIPGHTYRVFGRFNTFESDPAAGDWRLSFHGCADPPGQGLTVAQLSGKEPLPSGATLPDGVRIASFGTKGQTTNGKWMQVSTGSPGACADIEIPEGSTSLSAWVRITGTTPNRFGMDWSALEDVTPPAPH